VFWGSLRRSAEGGSAGGIWSADHGETEQLKDELETPERAGIRVDPDVTARAGHTRHPDCFDPGMTQEDESVVKVVPPPSTDSEEEHNRIRKSNDRDQQLERDGKTSPHNVGYDETADLKSPE